MPSVISLFLLPFLAALISFGFYRVGHFKRFAFLISLLPIALLIWGNTSWIGLYSSYQWLPALSIKFHLKIDELSFLFLSLTALITPIAIYAVETKGGMANKNFFYGLIFLTEGLLFGFFMAADLVVFTLFWEAILFPLYFMITLWGGVKREQAALKFLIYMIAGSSLMVAAVLALFFSHLQMTSHPSFDLTTLAAATDMMPYAPAIGAIFLLAFAVKSPLFPFHGWLPETYYEAPTAATILLSALLSKAGIYGVIRIGLGLFPFLVVRWAPLLLSLAIIGTLWGALAAWRQTDFKKLIAYSSLSHVNFILAGLFVWNQTAHAGAVLQAINHGITITALFLVAAWLEERLGSSAIGPVTGVAKFLPRLCWLTLIFVLSSVALPGTNNFIGELMVLFGLFVQNPYLAALLGLSIIFSVIYLLRWMEKVYFGTAHSFSSKWKDIGAKEFLIASPLVFLVFAIGIYPGPLLTLIEIVTSVKQ